MPLRSRLRPRLQHVQLAVDGGFYPGHLPVVISQSTSNVRAALMPGATRAMHEGYQNGTNRYYCRMIRNPLLLSLPLALRALCVPFPTIFSSSLSTPTFRPPLPPVQPPVAPSSIRDSPPRMRCVRRTVSSPVATLSPIWPASLFFFARPPTTKRRRRRQQHLSWTVSVAFHRARPPPACRRRPSIFSRTVRRHDELARPQ